MNVNHTAEFISNYAYTAEADFPTVAQCVIPINLGTDTKIIKMVGFILKL